METMLRFLMLRFLSATFGLLVLASAITPSATAGEVKAGAARGVDLSRYKTFQILPVRVLTKKGIVEDDPVVSPVIAAALRRELTEKGLTEVSASPDLQVLPGALQTVFPSIDFLFYNFAGDAEWGTSPVVTIGRYNKEGTVFVNLVDPRDDKSVWLGFAKRALGKPSSLKGDIDKAADALFKKYPSLK
jgi:hypothetical protein